MHIALANRWYPPHTGYGGVAAYNSYLARALVELGHRVTIVAARWSPNAPAYHDDDGVGVYRLLSQYRHRLHRLPILGRNMRSLEQLAYSLRVDRVLKQLEQRDRPDIVEFAEVNAEGFVYLRRRAHVPAVVRCHTPTFILRHYSTSEEAPYNTAATAAMEKSCIRRANAITAPSLDMARTIAQVCGMQAGRIATIPNGLDVDRFAAGDRQRTGDAQDHGATVLHVGRLDRVKGIEVLARAIPWVVAEAPHAHFVFAGEGDGWQARLTGFLRARRVEDRVTFLGGVDQETLAGWYRRADIAVVPSLNYESFSYTCAQAMAAGLPLVASCVGGIPETIGQESGILVRPGDVTGLSAAIIRLIKDPQLRRQMGDAGRNRARRLFAADVVAKQMVELYRSVA